MNHAIQRRIDLVITTPPLLAATRTKREALIELAQTVQHWADIPLPLRELVEEGERWLEEGD